MDNMTALEAQAALERISRELDESGVAHWIKVDPRGAQYDVIVIARGKDQGK